ncbi:hypothetical protein FGG08_002470 [Glutinoglossum americanum]|uniref:Uncharacterized protein n=1 Tax=Glutinoglossum americanum TaxID=1670608 RepID=A0A9P8IF46_9PEZI|nr:hypothetical protein FGG08_002470 [Glutinoglossum americanum]
MADFSEVNRKHFDERASSYDNKAWQQKTFDRLSQEILDRKDWIGVDWIEDPDDGDTKEEAPHEGAVRRTIRVLDFACGTGVPHVSTKGQAEVKLD